jgi:hypothetical protein
VKLAIKDGGGLGDDRCRSHCLCYRIVEMLYVG